MSEYNNFNINIPKSVKSIFNHNKIFIKGPHGEIYKNLHKLAHINYNYYQIILHSSSILNKREFNYNNKIFNLCKKLIFNMIKGVNQGFVMRLQLVGIGYRAKIENNILVLKLGYSHLMEYKIPKTITINVPKPTIISLFSINKELLGDVGAQIRGFRRPEPYKGKGIRYVGETIIRKEGKKT